MGNGDGTFQTVVTYGSGGSDAISVAVADVNGDGKPDLMVANECGDSKCATSGTVGVLLGNGDGTFQTAVTYGSGGQRTASVAVADRCKRGWQARPDGGERLRKSATAVGTVLLACCWATATEPSRRR